MRYEFTSINPNKNRKKKPRVVESYIIHRINRNKNFIAVFNGETGSGKSLATIRLAVDLSNYFDTPFSVQDNIAFTFQDLVKKITENKVKKPGYVYVFEEVGAVGSGASAAEWQSKANRLFSTFLQTSRCLNQILLFNCPSFYDLSAAARKKAHFKFEALRIDPRSKLSYFAPFRLVCKENKKYNKEKTYFFFLQYRQDNLIKKYKEMQFKLPPKEILDEYHHIKEEFVESKLQEMATEREGKKKDRTKDTIKRMLNKNVPKETILEYFQITPRYLNMVKKEWTEEGTEARA